MTELLEKHSTAIVWVCGLPFKIEGQETTATFITLKKSVINQRFDFLRHVNTELGQSILSAPLFSDCNRCSPVSSISENVYGHLGHILLVPITFLHISLAFKLQYNHYKTVIYSDLLLDTTTLNYGDLERAGSAASYLIVRSVL